jgi:hypothetical protein
MKWMLGALCLLSIGSGSAWAQDCASLTELGTQLSGALAEAELEQAQAVALKAKAAVLCQQKPLNGAQAAEIFRMIGASAFFNQDLAGATEAFSWASTIAPSGSISVDYGAKVAGLYEKTREQVAAEGSVTLSLAGDGEAWVNGQALRVGEDLALPVGRHLLQTREGGLAIKSRVLTLAAGADQTVTVGTVLEATVQSAPVQDPESSGEAGSMRSVALLGGGTALLATGGALLGLASKSHGEFDQAKTRADLTALQARTNMLGIAGLVTGVAGAGMVGANFVLSADSRLHFTIQGRW